MVKKKKNKDIPTWNNKSPFEKVLSVIGTVLSLIILVLAILQITKIWYDSIYVYEPLLGILMLVQALENWKYNKYVSYASLVAFGIVLLFALFVFGAR